jgi:hypothetical protein
MTSLLFIPDSTNSMVFRGFLIEEKVREKVDVQTREIIMSRSLIHDHILRLQIQQILSQI